MPAVPSGIATFYKRTVSSETVSRRMTERPVNTLKIGLTMEAGGALGGTILNKNPKPGAICPGLGERKIALNIYSFKFPAACSNRACECPILLKFYRVLRVTLYNVP